VVKGFKPVSDVGPCYGLLSLKEPRLFVCGLPEGDLRVAQPFKAGIVE